MRKIISMMIALLCMVVQTAWAEWEGSRTQANPYQISSVADRNTLATNVEAGNNTPPTFPASNNPKSSVSPSPS